MSNPAEITSVGQYVAEIPEIGFSGNVWWQETVGQDPGWWWFGGTPRGSFWWVIHVVSNVPICRGDCNCDGMVDFGDINPFVLALTDLPGWQQQFPGCPVDNPDVNEDGRVDFGDINPFVGLLSGGGGPCQ